MMRCCHLKSVGIESPNLSLTSWQVSVSVCFTFNTCFRKSNEYARQQDTKNMTNYNDLTISRDPRKHIGQASDSVPADAPAGPEAFDRKRHPTELLHYTSSNQFLQNSRSRASHHLSPLTSWLSVCYTTVFSVATPIGIRPVTATPGPNGKPLSS